MNEKHQGKNEEFLALNGENWHIDGRNAPVATVTTKPAAPPPPPPPPLYPPKPQTAQSK